jgi:hypothetical protein
VQQNRHPPDFKRDLAVVIQSLAAPWPRRRIARRVFVYV